MLPEQIDTMLRGHKACVARCAHLAVYIQELEKDLQREMERALGDEAIKARQYTDIPIGTDISSPVEHLVLKYFDGYVPPHVQDMRAELAELRAEQEQAQRNIRYVEGWLHALTQRERDLIELQVIEGAYWSEVLHRLGEKHGNVFSKSGWRKMKGRAIRKIYQVAR